MPHIHFVYLKNATSNKIFRVKALIMHLERILAGVGARAAGEGTLVIRFIARIPTAIVSSVTVKVITMIEGSAARAPIKSPIKIDHHPTSSYF